jgi:hypothetical protein
VSPTGSDSNNGSASAPWATIQHAANSVGPGATVLVADGTYNQCSGGTIVNITSSGTSSAPITFQSQNKWGAKLVGDTSCGLGFAVRASYIVINNFDISGFGATSSQGIYLASGTNHVIFGNNIHNISNISQSNSYGDDGIFVSSSNDLIDANFIHDVGRTNTVNLDHGIYVDGSLGASSTTIQNNVIYNTPQGWCVQLYPGSVSGVTIINNTFDCKDTHNSGSIIAAASPLANSRIANNIFYNPGGGVAINMGSCCGGSFSNVTVEHNVTTGSSMTDMSASGVTFSNNILSASPSVLVSNEAGADYHLVTGSPAIGAGTSVGAPSVDIEGTSRSQLSRYDVGAYEYPH